MAAEIKGRESGLVYSVVENREAWPVENDVAEMRMRGRTDERIEDAVAYRAAMAIFLPASDACGVRCR